MSSKFFPVKLAFILNDQFTSHDIYLKIGSEYIHYLKEGENNTDQLKKLLIKNCEHVFLNPRTLKQYMALKKNLLATELIHEKNNIKCLEQFTGNYTLLKEFYTGICNDETKASYIAQLGKQSITILEKNSFINTLFDNFRKGNSEHIVFKEMVAFFSVFSLKYFDNIPDDQLEKMNVAILLSDILLDTSQIKGTYTSYSSDISKDVLNHPQNAIHSVPKEPYFDSSTIINLIKNHHERPDGLGYPNRISFTRFDIFLCTHYIAEQIVLKLIEKDMKINLLESIYAEVVVENLKYCSPNFKRAFSNFDKFIYVRPKL